MQEGNQVKRNEERKQNKKGKEGGRGPIKYSSYAIRNIIHLSPAQHP